MFSWVVKVTPQLPGTPGTLAQDVPRTPDIQPKTKEVKSPAAKPQPADDQLSQDSQGQSGVLGWLSNGFSSALPKPSGTPGLGRTNSDARPVEDGERVGVMGWVTQGLTKVLPQPEEKYRESDQNHKAEHDELTEVHPIEEIPDYEPLPHIPVVEMVSEDEMSEAENLTPQFPPKVVRWIQQAIPQPVTLPPGAVATEPSPKPPRSNRSSLDKVLSPPPESLSGISLDTDGKPGGMMGWFVSGFGLLLPQPSVKAKENNPGATEVLQKASARLKPDMVLEDVDSDHEDRVRKETLVPTPPPPPPPPPLARVQEETQAGPALDGPGTGQEDAETQTGRWTPLINSIKREAEDVALATMEERLLQERVEMIRIAEDVGRQAAETAVRQMAAERGSIKLSLGSEELLLGEPDTE